MSNRSTGVLIAIAGLAIGIATVAVLHSIHRPDAPAPVVTVIRAVPAPSITVLPPELTIGTESAPSGTTMAVPAADGKGMVIVPMPVTAPERAAGASNLPMAAAPVTAPADAASAALSRAEARLAAATWPSLSQLEINHLQMALADMPKHFVEIFCADEAYCGELQMDFDNALETANWETRLEKPMFPLPAGLSTSSPELKEAIEKATHGRLKVALIPKQAEWFALAIGKRGK
jgi:hypothetical protein